MLTPKSTSAKTMMKWHPMMKLHMMKNMMKEKKKKAAMMKMKMKMNDFMKEMKMKEKAAMEPGQMMKKKAAMKPMKVMKMKAALQPMKVMKMKAATKLCGAPKHAHTRALRWRRARANSSRSRGLRRIGACAA